MNELFKPTSFYAAMDNLALKYILKDIEVTVTLYILIVALLVRS